MSRDHIKFVVAGDTKVGKTAFLTTWAMGNYPHEYIASVFCSWSGQYTAKNGNVYIVTPWDTVGTEDMRKMNKLSYVGTDVFVYCYSIADPASFEHLMTWVHDCREACPDAPCVLFGLKADLRDDAEANNSSTEGFVTHNQGKELASVLGAKAFFEISALKDTQRTFSEALSAAFEAAIKHMESQPDKASDNHHVTSNSKKGNSIKHVKKLTTLFDLEKCSIQ